MAFAADYCEAGPNRRTRPQLGRALLARGEARLCGTRPCLISGYCGVKPNEFTCNCIVNAGGSMGDFKQAQEFVDLMQGDGIKVGHHTLSILLRRPPKGCR